MAGVTAATAAGTARYFTPARSAAAPVTLGRTGWQVSPVGFGSYRISEANSTHEEALRLALLSGCNLIDTSANYTDGSSERLVGKVLNDLLVQGALTREEIVVVTKAGYVQGAHLSLARSRLAQGHPFPEMVEFSGDCWHCIAPEFLEDQITRSLSRLTLERIDVLLLHNPEYFLKAGGPHSEYYERIERAFRYLETEVTRGRIQYYGISSNTFPHPKESAEYTSLETIIGLAKRISPEHHFAVIEFPLNVFEPQAVLEKNNSGRTVLELAMSEKLGTLINRPLNAFQRNAGLVRLADFPPHDDEDVVGRLQAALKSALELENQPPSPQTPNWAHVIQGNWNRIASIETWTDILAFQIEPAVAASLHSLKTRSETRLWAEKYETAMQEVFSALTAYLESQAAVRSSGITGKLLTACPELAGSPTLSQKVLRLYRALPGVHTVLVGMRKPAYVADALAPQPPLPLRSAMAALRATEPTA